MQITNEAELPWTSEDIEHFRAFLKTETGSRMLPKLMESSPVLLGKGDVNEILIRSGELRGFQQAAQAFLALTVYPPPPAPPSAVAYPPLDADEHWEEPKDPQTPKQ